MVDEQSLADMEIIYEADVQILAVFEAPECVVDWVEFVSRHYSVASSIQCLIAGFLFQLKLIPQNVLLSLSPVPHLANIG